ncbi:MAG: YdiY family protein [Candidatus Omnitrophota bacterium]
MRYIMFFLFIGFLVLSVRPAKAAEVVLTNGDRISGTILQDSAESLTIATEAMGKVTLDRAFVERPCYEECPSAEHPKEDRVKWDRSLSAGYSRWGGNTVKTQANGELKMNRKTEQDETTFKGSLYYASSEGKMDAQQWYILGRYAYSFGPKKHWYHFYRLEADHDRFSDIDYRLTPATGLGCWFADGEEYKLMTELAVAHEYTNYRTGASSNEALLTPRVYYERLIMEKLRFSQDLIGYVPVDGYDQYRLRSETSLKHSLNDRLSCRLSFIDEYNADPAAGSKDNDYRLIYALEYSF